MSISFDTHVKVSTKAFFAIQVLSDGGLLGLGLRVGVRVGE